MATRGSQEATVLEFEWRLEKNLVWSVFFVVVVVVTWLLVVALGLQSVSQSEKMIWWISTTFRIVVIEEPRRVSLLYVCLRFDKVKMLDYINYEKEKRVCNFHQSKPCGCSNDNVCYSRRYVIIGARTLRGDFCDRGASARKSPPMESRRWWWWWLCWNRLAGKMMKLGESATPGWWWEGGGAQKQQHGWTKGM